LILIGASIRSENAAAAAAAAMAAATNKFFRQQSSQPIPAEPEKPQHFVSSPSSPMMHNNFSSNQDTHGNDIDKKSASIMVQRNTTTSPSVESCGGEDMSFPAKIASLEANGSMSNDIDSNCSTANSND